MPAKSKKQITRLPATPPATPPALITRGLSLCEPWAWAVVAGFKPIENRTWATSFRGWLAIHASSSTRSYTPENDAMLCGISRTVRDTLNDQRVIDGTHQAFNFGAFVGVVEIFDCLDSREFPDMLRSTEDFLSLLNSRHPGFVDSLSIGPDLWAEGPCCFLVRNAIQFTRPIRAKGALNVFNLAPEMQTAIAAELEYTAQNPPAGYLIADEFAVAAETGKEKALKAKEKSKPQAKPKAK